MVLSIIILFFFFLQRPCLPPFVQTNIDSISRGIATTKIRFSQYFSHFVVKKRSNTALDVFFRMQSEYTLFVHSYIYSIQKHKSFHNNNNNHSIWFISFINQLSSFLFFIFCHSHLAYALGGHSLCLGILICLNV